MNPILKYSAYSIGAAVLFVGSFLSFAALSGTPMNELAVVGKLFPAPEEDTTVASEEGSPDLSEEIESDTRSTRAVIEEAASPLQAFVLQSPFTTEDLDSLQRELKNRVQAVDALRTSVEAREKELAVRERQLEEKWAELEKIRNALIEHDIELDQRQDELVRDAEVQRERENASWRSLAKVFESGKAKDIVRNLVLYDPADAARILRALPDERASELLSAVPRESWAEYAEAYRKAEK